MCGEYGDYEVDATVGPGDRVMLDRVQAGDGVAHIARHEANTLQRGPFFIYMDVGRWGGNQRQFGLVYGDASASEFLLCAYHPQGGQGTAPARAEPINNLINCGEFRGKIQVLHRLLYTGLGLNTQGTLYVFLGDLHLPLIYSEASLDEIRAIPHKLIGGAAAAADSALPAEDLRGAIRNLGWLIAPFSTTVRELLGEVTVERWRELYLQGDIFRGAGPSLCRFIRGLGHFCQNFQQWCGRGQRPRVHFMQVGDMYEHWIGLERIFEPAHFQVQFSPPPATTIRDVRAWIARTNRSNEGRLGPRDPYDLARTLHTCPVDRRTWIVGNHDNYLRALGRVPRQRTDPPRRFVSVTENEVFVEHGHGADQYNRDGATRGHLITQAVFLRSMIRSFDPDRRADFLRYAAYKFHRRRGGRRAFKAFIMAHTHQAWLTPIYVRSASA